MARNRQKTTIWKTMLRCFSLPVWFLLFKLGGCYNVEGRRNDFFVLRTPLVMGPHVILPVWLVRSWWWVGWTWDLHFIANHIPDSPPKLTFSLRPALVWHLRGSIYQYQGQLYGVCRRLDRLCQSLGCHRTCSLKSFEHLLRGCTRERKLLPSSLFARLKTTEYRISASLP